MLIKNENDVKALREVSKQIKTDKARRVFLGLRNYVHKSMDCSEWTDQCDGLLWDDGEEFNSTIFKPGMYIYNFLYLFIAESSSLGNTLKSFMKNQSFTEFGVKINITKGSACVMATIYDKSINLFGGGDLQCEKWSTGKSYQIHATCQSKCIKVCMDPPKAAKSGTLKTNFKNQYVPADKIE